MWLPRQHIFLILRTSANWITFRCISLFQLFAPFANTKLLMHAVFDGHISLLFGAVTTFPTDTLTDVCVCVPRSPHQIRRKYPSPRRKFYVATFNVEVPRLSPRKRTFSPNQPWLIDDWHSKIYMITRIAIKLLPLTGIWLLELSSTVTSSPNGSRQFIINYDRLPNYNVIGDRS